MNLMTFHVERLYDDRCWREFRKVLDQLETHGIRATCFVFPPLHRRHTEDPSFGADGERKFVARLAETALRGHDIQQHTHIYAPDRKENLITPENCLRTIGREKAYLEKLGYPITGFLSGGFAINDVVADALSALGFTYDCSVTLFEKTYRSETLPGVVGLTRLRQGLIELPTTHTSKMMVLNAKSPARTAYRMVYAHDYDFIRRAYRWSMRGILFRYGGKQWKTVAEYLRDPGFPGPTGPEGLAGMEPEGNRTPSSSSNKIN